MNRRIEIQRIKQLSIVEFLASWDIHPVKRQSGRLWYVSPLRPEEKEPSLCVYAEKPIQDFYDFGEAKGGSIIDLAMVIFRQTYPQAMSMLRKSLD